MRRNSAARWSNERSYVAVIVLVSGREATTFVLLLHVSELACLNEQRAHEGDKTDQKSVGFIFWSFF